MEASVGLGREPGAASCRSGSEVCTSRVAVMISILDRILFRVLNQGAEEKFSVELFTRSKFLC